MMSSMITLFIMSSEMLFDMIHIYISSQPWALLIHVLLSISYQRAFPNPSKLI